MELVNELYAVEPALSGAITGELCRMLTLMLAPFAPYTAQDLWEILGNEDPVFRHAWPEFDPALAKEDLIEVTVQVNGRVRGHISVVHDISRDELERLARAAEKVQPFLTGKQIVKVIVVPLKLVNFVVK